MVQIQPMLSRLNAAKVEFVIVGGVAARLHGSTYPTLDLDVCCAMTTDNMGRLIDALRDLHPIVRGDPRRLKMPTNPDELAKFRMLILSTDLGDFDVIKELEGVGDFSVIEPRAQTMEVYGQPARVVDLDSLIIAKSKAGRVKDKMGLLHLEALKKLQEKRDQAF